MRKFVVGDIHGNYLGLKQVLERSGFDKENDLLITLGDICDGYSGVYECVEELLTIKNRIDIRGNHDEPFVDFIETGIHSWAWAQGGTGTLKSYANHADTEIKFIPKGLEGRFLTNLNPADVPETHKEFFKHQILYYVDEENNCFVHGGFNRHYPIKEQIADVLQWDRDLWLSALSFKEMPEKGHHITGEDYKFKIKDGFKEVFIGHTTTINWKTTEPMKAANIWNLDTGGGFAGKVSIMNIDTHEYFQSDLTDYLYPDEKGRRKK